MTELETKTQTQLAKEEEPKRISFEFPPRAHARLKSLKTRTESKTYADVIRRSLRLYEWFLENEENGTSLALQRNDGTFQSVEILLSR